MPFYESVGGCLVTSRKRVRWKRRKDRGHSFSLFSPLSTARSKIFLWTGCFIPEKLYKNKIGCQKTLKGEIFSFLRTLRTTVSPPSFVFLPCPSFFVHCYPSAQLHTPILVTPCRQTQLWMNNTSSGLEWRNSRLRVKRRGEYKERGVGGRGEG